jgi:hypothetical protein
MTAVGNSPNRGTAEMKAVARIEAEGDTPTVATGGGAVLDAISDIQAIGSSPNSGFVVMDAIADAVMFGAMPRGGSATIDAVARLAAVGGKTVSGSAEMKAVARMAAEGRTPTGGYAVMNAVARIAAEGSDVRTVFDNGSIPFTASVGGLLMTPIVRRVLDIEPGA